MTRWREVEVVRGRGAPTIALHGRYRARAEQLGAERIHVSLTHGRDSAVAFAVAESAERQGQSPGAPAEPEQGGDAGRARRRPGSGTRTRSSPCTS